MPCREPHVTHRRELAARRHRAGHCDVEHPLSRPIAGTAHPGLVPRLRTRQGHGDLVLRGDLRLFSARPLSRAAGADGLVHRHRLSFSRDLAYKDYLIERFGLSVRDVRPEEWKHVYTAQEQVYRSDPDFCCSVNKVEPLEEMKKDYQVWVSSLMRWQTPHRAG